MQRHEARHQPQDTGADPFPECTQQQQDKTQRQNGQRRAVTVEHGASQYDDIPDGGNQERPAVNDDGDDGENSRG